MKKMSSRTVGLLLGFGSVALAGGIPLIAAALPAGTPAAGTVTIAPLTGTSAQTFTVTPPNGAACPGDNTTGYLYHSFITPFGNDPADFLYSFSGTPQGEPAFTNNLANTAGLRSRNLQPGLGDGLVIAVSNQSFANALFATLTPGVYTVGIACTLPDAANLVQTQRFWKTEITIQASPGAGPNGLTYTVGIIQPPPPTTVPPPPTTVPPPPTTVPPPPTTVPPPPTTVPPPPTTVPPPPTTTLPPTTTTTTTLPPTTTTTTTTTLPPTTTTTTTLPPKPVTGYEATCVGGPFRSATDGVLDNVGRARWLSRFVIFTPDGGRPMLGIVKDREVVKQGDDRDDDRDDDRASGRRGSRRDSTCVTEPFTNSKGKTVVLELRIRFV